MTICTATVLFAACTEPEIPMQPKPPVPPDSNDETFVTFTFGIDSPVTVTRAANENTITNLQLLLIGTDGTRYFFEPGNSKSVTAKIRRSVYDIYAVANYDSSIANCSPNDLMRCTAVCRSDGSHPAMSFTGRADFTSETSPSYSVKLVRTVAKLRFNVTTAPAVTITDMTLCSVPLTARLFQSDTANLFENIAVDVPSGGAFTIYMPENLAGIVSSITNQRQRTLANAPAQATYLLIGGTVMKYKDDGATEERGFEGVVCLGGNVTDDFNIRRNNDYRIDINIADDLRIDTRIVLYRVGHVYDARLTPDRKYIIGGSAIKLEPFFMEGEKGVGAETVIYSYIFEKKTFDRLQADGRYILNNTIYGTLTAGESFSHRLYYDAELFTPENCLVRYTLSFTDEYCGTTEYHGEFRFANTTGVQILPLVSGSTARKAIIQCTSDESVVEDGDYTYTVYHAKRTLQITALPLSGYTFKGWYSDAGLKTLIGSSPTIYLSVPRKSNYTVYAKVE